MFYATAGQAQQVNVPSPPTREEIERGTILPDLRGASAPLALDGAVERSPCPLADARFAELRFTLAEAQFTGAGAIGSTGAAAGAATGASLTTGAGASTGRLK